jgi:hypothetical protein
MYTKKPSTPEKKPDSLLLANPPDLPISGTERRKGPKTRMIIKCDVGFGNSLFLRGKGANLSWDYGVPLQNFKSDEWTWETEASFNSCEFKVLINDKIYEVGENHQLSSGTTIQYTPKFS